VVSTGFTANCTVAEQPCGRGVPRSPITIAQSAESASRLAPNEEQSCRASTTPFRSQPMYVDVFTESVQPRLLPLGVAE
jgi:hypothetical protein